MTVTVKLFAAAKDLAGVDSLEVNSKSGVTVAVLRRLLAEQMPVLAGLLARSAIAVNHDFAEETVVVNEGDEVAVIPPVSGG
ncbi:molybdopterin converting factor subunit 1 [soil metagenome]